jgi:carbon monoxide dehydrogenase subunit G|tara:strand:- start:10106 stop:10621 length:516 start_codon:yes stop_codon:yes gene_type:complete
LDFKDDRIIAASPEKVWAYLLDPEILRECVPGCQSLTGDVENGFEATVVQKVGPVKAKFKGTVHLSELNAPHSLRISGKGEGGVAGFARGGADVTLEADELGTKLSYVVKAQIGGKLAQLGSRIIDSFVSQMANQFFETFQGEVEGANLSVAEVPMQTIGFWKKIIRIFKT